MKNVEICDMKMQHFFCYNKMGEALKARKIIIYFLGVLKLKIVTRIIEVKLSVTLRACSNIYLFTIIQFASTVRSTLKY